MQCGFQKSYLKPVLNGYSMCICRSIAKQIEILIFRYICSNHKTLNLYTFFLLGNSQDVPSLPYVDSTKVYLCISCEVELI